jgi:hypothetical protein
MAATLASAGTPLLVCRNTTTAKDDCEISSHPLSKQVLSDALFAACGVNRAEGPFGTRGVTAASASNSQEIDFYVALHEGTFRFEPDGHKLAMVTGEDLRLFAFTPHQPPIPTEAPTQLTFVVDIASSRSPRASWSQA